MDVDGFSSLRHNHSAQANAIVYSRGYKVLHNSGAANITLSKHIQSQHGDSSFSGGEPYITYTQSMRRLVLQWNGVRASHVHFREARHPPVTGGNRSGGGGDALGSRRA